MTSIYRFDCYGLFTSTTKANVLDVFAREPSLLPVHVASLAVPLVTHSRHCKWTRPKVIYPSQQVTLPTIKIYRLVKIVFFLSSNSHQLSLILAVTYMPRIYYALTMYTSFMAPKKKRSFEFHFLGRFRGSLNIGRHHISIYTDLKCPYIHTCFVLFNAIFVDIFFTVSRNQYFLKYFRKKNFILSIFQLIHQHANFQTNIYTLILVLHFYKHLFIQNYLTYRFPLIFNPTLL